MGSDDAAGVGNESVGCDGLVIEERSNGDPLGFGYQALLHVHEVRVLRQLSKGSSYGLSQLGGCGAHLVGPSSCVPSGKSHRC